MTKDEIIAVTLSRVHRSGDAVLTPLCATELVAAQSRLEKGVMTGQGAFLPWFLFKDKTDLTFTANVDAVTVPADFIQEFDEDHTGSLFLAVTASENNDEQWKRLERQSWSVIQNLYPGFSDTLRFYDLLNDKLFLRPMPNFAGTLRLMYYAKADSLSSASSNVWTTEASELLICELGKTLCRYYIRDAKAADAFANDVVVESRRLYVSHIARLEAGRQRSRGED